MSRWPDFHELHRQAAYALSRPVNWVFVLIAAVCVMLAPLDPLILWGVVVAALLFVGFFFAHLFGDPGYVLRWGISVRYMSTERTTVQRAVETTASGIYHYRRRSDLLECFDRMMGDARRAGVSRQDLKRALRRVHFKIVHGESYPGQSGSTWGGQAKRNDLFHRISSFFNRPVIVIDGRRLKAIFREEIFVRLVGPELERQGWPTRNPYGPGSWEEWTDAHIGRC